MPWFEVNVVSSILCLVEADTPDEAIQYAREESGGADPGHQEFDCKSIEDANELESLMRHADYVSHA